MYTVHDLHVYSTWFTCIQYKIYMSVCGWVKFQMNNVLLCCTVQICNPFEPVLNEMILKEPWGFGWIFAMLLARWWTVEHCFVMLGADIYVVIMQRCCEDKSLSNQWSMQLSTCYTKWVWLCKGWEVAGGLLVKALDCGSKDPGFQSHYQQQDIGWIFTILPKWWTMLCQ